MTEGLFQRGGRTKSHFGRVSPAFFLTLACGLATVTGPFVERLIQSWMSYLRISRPQEEYASASIMEIQCSPRKIPEAASSAAWQSISRASLARESMFRSSSSATTRRGKCSKRGKLEPGMLRFFRSEEHTSELPAPDHLV